MKKEWLKYLVDPVDQTRLNFGQNLKNDKDGLIESGSLISKSGHKYKIKNGVPILLTRKGQTVSSVESFAYEWEHFDFDFGKQGWLKNIVKPVLRTPSYFKNKVIIECGTGSGRHARWMAEYGAKLVISVELSNSVHGIAKAVTEPYRDKVMLVQADIANIPINPKTTAPDLVTCVNVIQHTKDPAKTLTSLSGILTRKGRLLFNVYLQRGRSKSLAFLGALRSVTQLLPSQVLLVLTFLVSLTVYHSKFNSKAYKYFSRLFPISDTFKETWLNFYDLLGKHHFQRFYSEQEVDNLLGSAGLKILRRKFYVMLLAKT